MENKVSHWWDATAILTLIAALWMVVWRIQETNWTKDLYRLETLVGLGLLLGFFLGKSRFRSRWVVWMGIFYTFFFILMQLGLTLGEGFQWPTRLFYIFARLSKSINLVLHNQPVLDPLLFLTLMSLLYWLISFIGSYQLVRNGRPWMPLFIAGIALGTIDYYDADFVLRPWFDGIFFLLSLMLISRVFFLNSRKNWEEKGAVLDPDVGLNVGGTVFLGGLIVILIAWNFPFFTQALRPGTPAQEQTTITWDSLRTRLGNIVAGLRGKPVYGVTAFPDQMKLGTGQLLGDNLIFTVTASTAKPEGKHYYWRGYSYDHYALGFWRSTQELSETKTPREWNYQLQNWIGRQFLTFSITPESSSQRTIFAPDIPVSASRTARVVRVNLSDVTVTDMVTLQADTPLEPGEIFSVESWVSTPTVTQLLAANQNYPDWVTSRYLQVPPDMPRRIKDLAVTITDGQQTQYDQVVAITNYLRKAITYQAVIPNPPANRDPIDWFLFDYKKGFCNYYASAEVLMLRSIGIPARMAVGYAEGTSDQNEVSFKVKEHDSHAWPEVFFTNAGWVEFEPTSSQPPTDLPLGADVTQTNEDTQLRKGLRTEPQVPPLQPTGAGNSNGNYPGLTLFYQRFGIPLIFSTSILALFVLLGYTWQHTQLHLLPVWTVGVMRRRGLSVPKWLEQWAWRAQLSQMEWMYFQINWMLRILGRRVVPGQTPSERAQVLVSIMPSGKASIQAFIEEYLKAEYSPHYVDILRARLANRQLWKRVFSTWISRVKGL
jgi:transglutaminase-like putative cysteine protease